MSAAAENQARLTIAITYDPVRLAGRLERVGEARSSIWDRLRARAISDPGGDVTDTSIELPWPDILSIVREFGTKQSQQALHFRFAPSGEAAERLRQFAAELREVRAARDTLSLRLSRGEILQRLQENGFTRRELKPFQLRDLERCSTSALIGQNQRGEERRISGSS
jgi:hypothetical protein